MASRSSTALVLTALQNFHRRVTHDSEELVIEVQDAILKLLKEKALKSSVSNIYRPLFNMGDYSSTFKIKNLLDSDVNLTFPDPSSGYWLRRPTNVVRSNAVTAEFQLKDKIGIVGTDGQVHVHGMLNGREFVAWIHVKCGVREINTASFESADRRLHLYVSGFTNPQVNPMTGITFVISAV